jgi:hypothetical protein
MANKTVTKKTVKTPTARKRKSKKENLPTYYAEVKMNFMRVMFYGSPEDQSIIRRLLALLAKEIEGGAQ